MSPPGGKLSLGTISTPECVPPPVPSPVPPAVPPLPLAKSYPPLKPSNHSQMLFSTEEGIESNPCTEDRHKGWPGLSSRLFQRHRTIAHGPPAEWSTDCRAVIPPKVASGFCRPGMSELDQESYRSVTWCTYLDILIWKDRKTFRRHLGTKRCWIVRL